MVAARMKPLFEREARERMRAGKAANPMANLPQGPARDLAAAALHVSPRSVEDASKVLREGAPELGRAVEEGRVSVSAAAALTGLPRAEQAEVAARGKREAAAAAKKVREQKKAKTEAVGTGAAASEPRLVGAPVPFKLGQVLPPHVRAELRLTPEQDKEVATLEKEVKGRLNQILNKEQKRQLAAMRLPGRPTPDSGTDRRRGPAKDP